MLTGSRVDFGITGLALPFHALERMQGGQALCPRHSTGANRDRGLGKRRMHESGTQRH